MQSLTPLEVLCSILVANNGIGAVKFIRSVRSWAYKTFGSERAVSLVAMATPEVLRLQDRLMWRDAVHMQASVSALGSRHTGVCLNQSIGCLLCCLPAWPKHLSEGT